MGQFITMETKAFSNENRRVYRLSVDRDGTVRVWDSVAKNFTTCHCMTERSMACARRKAGHPTASTATPSSAENL